MPADFPAGLIPTKNALFTDSAWIVILDIVFSPTRKWYLCANNEDIEFPIGGQVYTAFPFTFDPPKQSSKGDLPTISLKVSNVTYLIQADVEALNGVVGSAVKIRVVNSNYLAEGYVAWEMDFVITSTSLNAEWITFTLGIPSPLRRRFPQYRYIARHCNWEFKSCECKYVGGFTTCDRSFDNCERLNNTENFGGFMGLSTHGWRPT